MNFTDLAFDAEKIEPVATGVGNGKYSEDIYTNR
jgi:hypothetical protein